MKRHGFTGAHSWVRFARYATSFEPTPKGWDQGDHAILCVISTENAAGALTGSVRDSSR